MTKRNLRNDAFFKAKKYAMNSDISMARAWLERAEKFCPLTEMQAWRFKTWVGLEQFMEIAPKRLLEFDFANKP